ncbi:hypothetical protein BDN72DRAFT_896082 [Pluteus cervinus]|uniref:Uncharacterized protein n=1 Tax=Pluteus cervinus TaxID=181527 RepID=A0ACD3AYP4_9AGAR|nr:hypothetical protein BDN72DRAFT_896082 [Pluteus cervinus]
MSQDHHQIPLPHSYAMSIDEHPWSSSQTAITASPSTTATSLSSAFATHPIPLHYTSFPSPSPFPPTPLSPPLQPHSHHQHGHISRPMRTIPDPPLQTPFLPLRHHSGSPGTGAGSGNTGDRNSSTYPAHHRHGSLSPSTATRVASTLGGSFDPNTGIYYRTPEHPRLRTAQACEKCRTRKAKCSGEHPSCKRCVNRGLVCEYAKEGRVRGPNKPKGPKTSQVVLAGSASAPATPSNGTRKHPPANSSSKTSGKNTRPSSSCAGMGDVTSFIVSPHTRSPTASGGDGSSCDAASPLTPTSASSTSTSTTTSSTHVVSQPQSSQGQTEDQPDNLATLFRKKVSNTMASLPSPPTSSSFSPGSPGQNLGMSVGYPFPPSYLHQQRRPARGGPAIGMGMGRDYRYSSMPPHVLKNMRYRHLDESGSATGIPISNVGRHIPPSPPNIGCVYGPGSTWNGGFGTGSMSSTMNARSKPRPPNLHLDGDASNHHNFRRVEVVQQPSPYGGGFVPRAPMTPLSSEGIVGGMYAQHSPHIERQQQMMSPPGSLGYPTPPSGGSVNMSGHPLDMMNAPFSDSMMGVPQHTSYMQREISHGGHEVHDDGLSPLSAGPRQTQTFLPFGSDNNIHSSSQGQLSSFVHQQNPYDQHREQLHQDSRHHHGQYGQFEYIEPEQDRMTNVGAVPMRGSGCQGVTTFTTGHVPTALSRSMSGGMIPTSSPGSMGAGVACGQLERSASDSIVLSRSSLGGRVFPSPPPSRSPHGHPHASGMSMDIDPSGTGAGVGGSCGGEDSQFPVETDRISMVDRDQHLSPGISTDWAESYACHLPPAMSQSNSAGSISSCSIGSAGVGSARDSTASSTTGSPVGGSVTTSSSSLAAAVEM